MRVDAPLDLADVDWPLYEEIIQLEPFGMGNPTPVFGACGVRLVATPRILQEKHLKLRVGTGARTLDALGWGWAARAPSLERASRWTWPSPWNRTTIRIWPACNSSSRSVATGGMEIRGTRGIGLERARRQDG